MSLNSVCLSIFFLFFFRVHYCALRGTEPHVALREKVHAVCVMPDHGSKQFRFKSQSYVRCVVLTVLYSVLDKYGRLILLVQQLCHTQKVRRHLSGPGYPLSKNTFMATSKRFAKTSRS